jgi:hypothetical protein
MKEKKEKMLKCPEIEIKLLLLLFLFQKLII